jgi:odorant receptor
MMQISEPKFVGLIADLMPNIRLMQAFGHFIFRYIAGPILIRKLYSVTHLVLLLFQFACIIWNLAKYTNNVNELTCNL